MDKKWNQFCQQLAYAAWFGGFTIIPKFKRLNSKCERTFIEMAREIENLKNELRRAKNDGTT